MTALTWLEQPVATVDGASTTIQQDFLVGGVRAWEEWRVALNEHGDVEVSDRGGGPTTIPPHVVPLVLGAIARAASMCEQAGVAAG